MNWISIFLLRNDNFFIHFENALQKLYYQNAPENQFLLSVPLPLKIKTLQQH